MNAGRTGQGARNRPGRRHRAGTAVLTLLAAAIAVTLLFALSARAIVSHAACTNDPVVARVAVTGDLEPAVAHLAQFFNRQQHAVAGRCAEVTVTAQAPATVAAGLGGTTPGQHQVPVDAWIPDADLWAGLARGRAGASGIQPTGIEVAKTALVVVMPRAAAARMPAFGATIHWRFLFPASVGGPSAALGLHVQFPDPASSTTGLTALMQLRRIFGQGRAARTDLARFVFNVQVMPTGTGQASLASLATPAGSASPGAGGTPSEPVTVTTEQAVIQFDRAHPQQPLAVRYPADGSYELSYPYLLTTTSPLTREVAREFGTLLRSPYATSYVQYEGFRAGSGQPGTWPASYGLASTPRLLAPLAAGEAASALRAWQRLSLGSRDLTLVDVSSSMATPAFPGGPTLEQVLAQAAGQGLAQFPDSTQMGVWAFASRLQGNLPYRQLVPVGPLPGSLGLVTRRQQIQRVTEAGQALAHVPATLYGSILAAYRQMVAMYQPRYTNAVVVLTAGVDDAPGDISARTLIHDLRRLSDPRRPVQVVIVMLGGAGDFTALRQIAAATGGQASVITSPSQIRRVFYHAMERRICHPHCGG